MCCWTSVGAVSLVALQAPLGSLEILRGGGCERSSLLCPFSSRVVGVRSASGLWVWCTKGCKIWHVRCCEYFLQDANFSNTLCCCFISCSWSYFHFLTLSSESFQFLPQYFIYRLALASPLWRLPFVPQSHHVTILLVPPIRIFKRLPRLLFPSLVANAPDKSHMVQGSNCIVNLNYPLLYNRGWRSRLWWGVSSYNSQRCFGQTESLSGDLLSLSICRISLAH